MKAKEIDNEITRLVMEKRLLKESSNRTKSEESQKEIRKRIIMINAEIKKLKMKYALIENELNQETEDEDIKEEKIKNR